MMANNIDEYIAGFPKETQVKLEQIRRAIQQEAPEAEETIKYAMPTYLLNGNLVHFAGYQHHIGLYPAPTALLEFKNEISAYKHTKGAVQFPLDQPLPITLIKRIVQYRIRQNREKVAKKKSARTCKYGHKYYKSSECPTCPVCEAACKPGNGFLALLPAPARRALEHEGITTLMQLSTKNEAELLTLHGFGKASLPALREALANEGLSFKNTLI